MVIVFTQWQSVVSLKIKTFFFRELDLAGNCYKIEVWVEAPVILTVFPHLYKINHP